MEATGLLSVQHQVVRLTVNPAKRRLHGTTEITALAPGPSTHTVGLHCCGLEITAVHVNGLPAAFRPAPEPNLGRATESGRQPSLTALCERAYHDYQALVQHEQGPQLLVSLPGGWEQLTPTTALPPAPPPAAPASPAPTALLAPSRSRPDSEFGTPTVSKPRGAGPPGQQQQQQGGGEPGSPGAATDPASAPAQQQEGVVRGQEDGEVPQSPPARPQLLQPPHPAVTPPGRAGSVGQAGGPTLGSSGAAGLGAAGRGGSATPAPAGQGGGASQGFLSPPPAAGPRCCRLHVAFTTCLTDAGSGALQLLTGQLAAVKARSALDQALDLTLAACSGTQGGGGGAAACPQEGGLPGGSGAGQGLGGVGGPAYVVSDPQLRRARALFPCVDAVGVTSTYDMHVTLPPGHVAVCGGELQGKTLAVVHDAQGQQAPHSSTFHFRCRGAVTAAHMLLATGPFHCLPQFVPEPGARGAAGGGQRQGGAEPGRGSARPLSCRVSHCAPPELLPELAHTTRPLYLALQELEQYLGCPFPFPQLNTAFVPPAAFAGHTPPLIRVGAGCIVASSELLVGPDVLEGRVECSMALVAGLARQWFGVLLLPRAAEDAWLLEGLAGHLEDVFARKWLGQNEVLWRRWKERQALLVADNGSAPPLCPRQPGSRTGGRAAGQPGQGLGGAASAQGGTAGTEMLEPGPLRRWKAAAVMRMLERRAGEDQFKDLIRGMVKAALVEMNSAMDPTAAITATPGPAHRDAQPADPATGAGGDARGDGGERGAGGGAPGSSDRLLSTTKFLRKLAAKTGFQASGPFAERWIYGRGCPHFTLGFVYKLKTNCLDLALRQTGSSSSLRAALAAARSAKSSSADDSMNYVKVLMNETEAVSEAHIRVGPEDSLVLLEDHQLLSKPGVKKAVRKPKPANPATAEGAKEEAGAEAAAVVVEAVEEPGAMQPGGARHPLLWVSLDPAADWLCGGTVLQPEACWLAQLDKSRDVVAQSQAVQALASLAGSFERPSLGAVQALAACLRNTRMFCRVRVEAALALGATAGADNGSTAVPILCQYMRSALFDEASHSPRPNNFNDLSEHIVLSSLPVAAALTSNEYGQSPTEVIELLLGFMAACDNSENMFSDARYLAVYVEALGQLRPGTPLQLAQLLAQLDRQLALEDLAPSPGYLVGCAVLSALTQLATQLTGEARDDVRQAVRCTLKQYARPGVPLQLRHAAARALMRLEVACVMDGKPEALLGCLLEQCSQAGWGAAGRTQLLLSALEVLGPVLAAREEDAEVEAQRVAVEPLTALRLYQVMQATPDAQARQLAFMLLQRLAGQDATLFRERDEVEEAAPVPARPSGQMARGAMGAGSIRDMAPDGTPTPRITAPLNLNLARLRASRSAAGGSAEEQTASGLDTALPSQSGCTVAASALRNGTEHSVSHGRATHSLAGTAATSDTAAKHSLYSTAEQTVPSSRGYTRSPTPRAESEAPASQGPRSSFPLRRPDSANGMPHRPDMASRAAAATVGGPARRGLLLGFADRQVRRTPEPEQSSAATAAPRAFVTNGAPKAESVHTSSSKLGLGGRNTPEPGSLPRGSSSPVLPRTSSQQPDRGHAPARSTPGTGPTRPSSANPARRAVELDERDPPVERPRLVLGARRGLQQDAAGRLGPGAERVKLAQGGQTDLVNSMSRRTPEPESSLGSGPRPAVQGLGGAADALGLARSAGFAPRAGHPQLQAGKHEGGSARPLPLAAAQPGERGMARPGASSHTAGGGMPSAAAGDPRGNARGPAPAVSGPARPAGKPMPSTSANGAPHSSSGLGPGRPGSATHTGPSHQRSADMNGSVTCINKLPPQAQRVSKPSMARASSPELSEDTRVHKAFRARAGEVGAMGQGSGTGLGANGAHRTMSGGGPRSSPSAAPRAASPAVSAATTGTARGVSPLALIDTATGRDGRAGSGGRERAAGHSSSSIGAGTGVPKAGGPGSYPRVGGPAGTREVGPSRLGPPSASGNPRAASAPSQRPHQQLGQPGQDLRQGGVQADKHRDPGLVSKTLGREGVVRPREPSLKPSSITAGGTGEGSEAAGAPPSPGQEPAVRRKAVQLGRGGVARAPDPALTPSSGNGIPQWQQLGLSKATPSAVKREAPNTSQTLQQASMPVTPAASQPAAVQGAAGVDRAGGPAAAPTDITADVVGKAPRFKFQVKLKKQVEGIDGTQQPPGAGGNSTMASMEAQRADPSMQPGSQAGAQHLQKHRLLSERPLGQGQPGAHQQLLGPSSQQHQQSTRPQPQQDQQQQQQQDQHAPLNAIKRARPAISSQGPGGATKQQQQQVSQPFEAKDPRPSSACRDPQPFTTQQNPDAQRRQHANQPSQLLSLAEPYRAQPMNAAGGPAPAGHAIAPATAATSASKAPGGIKIKLRLGGKSVAAPAESAQSLGRSGCVDDAAVRSTAQAFGNPIIAGGQGQGYPLVGAKRNKAQAGGSFGDEQGGDGYGDRPAAYDASGHATWKKARRQADHSPTRTVERRG